MTRSIVLLAGCLSFLLAASGAAQDQRVCPASGAAISRPLPFECLDRPPLLITVRAPLRYPTEYRNAGIAGRVWISFVVDSTGAVVPASVRVDSAEVGALERVVTDAVREWHLSPAMRQQKAVSAAVKLEVVFEQPTLPRRLQEPPTETIVHHTPTVLGFRTVLADRPIAQRPLETIDVASERDVVLAALREQLALPAEDSLAAICVSVRLQDGPLSSDPVLLVV